MTRTALLLCFVVALASLVAWDLLAEQPVEAAPEIPLPYYGSPDFTPGWGRGSAAHRVGAFSLTDQAGRRVTEKDLDGRITVVGTLFTACTGLCPRIAKELAAAEAALAGDPRVRFLFHTVTPEKDTPEVLQAYGRSRGLDPERWRLVTGDAGTIQRLLRHDYFLARPGTTGIHTESLVLVDGERRIRGLYNATLSLEVQRLVDDIQRL